MLLRDDSPDCDCNAGMPGTDIGSDGLLDERNDVENDDMS